MNELTTAEDWPTSADWEIDTFSQPQEVVNFASIGLSLSVSDIYRNVRWETERQ